ncbi:MULTISPECIES: hypothetical protein [unclassified Microcoleus]|uniref:hypothetical protein n=1 Tax=unclassified Microcoleus TaxID=2642155 RepID=UPI002FCFD38A
MRFSDIECHKSGDDGERMGVGSAIGNYLFTQTLPLCRLRNTWNFYQYKTQKMAIALD